MCISYSFNFSSDGCPPGSFSQNGLEPCKSCPLHFYQPLYGQTECLECPEQLSTDKMGATEVHQCIGIVGFYSVFSKVAKC